MKMYFSQKTNTVQPIEQDLGGMPLRECLEKTHIALDAAYAGFDNAVDDDLIDSYIYEINSLQKRYKHISDLLALEEAAREEELSVHSPIRALVSHVFG
ncbi:MAG: DUF2508 family protein [Acetatifactor sp.]|nr:DUF2508 family protein [Acetatifactor sp.]